MLLIIAFGNCCSYHYYCYEMGKKIRPCMGWQWMTDTPWQEARGRNEGDPSVGGYNMAEKWKTVI